MAILKRDNINTISTIILMLTAIFISTTILSSNTYATSATSSSTSATVHVPDACTLVSTLNTPHTATLSPGTSTGYGNSGGVNGIGQTTLKVTCNDSLGFAIYAIGYTEDTFGNTNLVSNTKNNGVSTYTIATGTNTSGSTSNWAMQINAVSGTFAPTIQNSFDSSSYHNVPTTYTMVAKRTSATMNPSDPSTSNTGSSITTTYAAYISTEQAPDTYTGKVKYTMVHPNNANSPVQPLAPTDCPALSICYAPNADDIVGSMDSISNTKIAKSATAGVQSFISANSTAILRAYNYSRSGYGFAGWSPSYEASTASGSTDIIYGPMATISTNPNDPEGADVSTNGLILYPVWVASTGTMQSFTSSDCNSMSVGDVTARTDVRDGNTYTIAKLVDGKCWMVENLRLNDDANITTSNTQSNNGSFGGVFTTLANSENANFDNTTNANSLYSTDGSTANVISGGSSSRIPRYNSNNTNRSLTASLTATSSSTYYQWYGYGNYYTWSATIADTTLYSTKNQSVENTSLCPTGWRLPKGGDRANEANNDIWALVVTGLNNGVNPANYDNSTFLYPYYTGTTEAGPVSSALRSYPNNFLYSGQYRDGIYTSDRGSGGYYWSSTVTGGLESNILWLNNSIVRPGAFYSYKWRGMSIRCLVSP